MDIITWALAGILCGNVSESRLGRAFLGVASVRDGAVCGVLRILWVPASAGMTWGEGLNYTSTTEFTKVPIPAIDMLTTSPSANVNSGGGIVPVPVHTVVPFGT